ncbi:unnamed protein product [Heterobilharzia americana]|nr:unnamed protein product [Heterobilharzia americana]
MECVIGIKMNDFVLLAADMRCAHSILTIKHDERKMYKFSNRVLAAVCGESGDTSQFSEYIQQNMQLYEIRNGYELTPSAAANFTRNNMAESLRSRSPYFVNMLIAGYDSQTGPELYFLDYLASLVKVCCTEVLIIILVSLIRLPSLFKNICIIVSISSYWLFMAATPTSLYEL